MPSPVKNSVDFSGGIGILDYGVIFVYALSMLAMGLWIARRQKSTADFFLGGRTLPAWAVGVSILASLLSTITYLGMPGEMFRTGLGFLTRQLGLPFVLVVVWFLWIPFFMRLNLTSAYEYLERRFNYAARALAAVCCLCLLFGWMAVVVLTASRAMGEIMDLDLAWFFGTNSEGHRDADLHAIILGIGLFSVVYTTLGGIRAVVWTDVIQFFILLGGAIFAMAYVSWETNSGLSDWIAKGREYPFRESVEWFSWDLSNRSTVFSISIGMFFWVICTHGANQVALQRYFAVKDQRAARRSYLVSAISSIGLGVLLAGVGLALMYFVSEYELPVDQDLYSTNADVRVDAQDKVFPQFIRYYLPPGLRGLVVAALFAAAMSTIDSGANSVSTIVTIDFFRPLRGHKIDAAAELRLARRLTATMGVIVVAATIFLYHLSKGTDIITLCQKGFNCFLGPLGALFVLGMFSRSSTGRTVVPAVIIGELFGVAASYSKELSNLFGYSMEYSTHLVVPGSWLVTIVVGLVLALATGSKPTEAQRRWMWRPVVTSDVIGERSPDD